MECKHEWKSVPAAGHSHGHFRDECANCGCIGVPDWNNPVDGIIPIIAVPMAKVIDLNEYRKQRALKTKGVANG